MNHWTKAALCGLVFAATSYQAFARDEIWQLTYWPAPWLTEIKSTWRITIADDGTVTGVSTWDARDSSGNANLSGKTNEIEGKITRKGDITLVRHLAGKNEGKSQRYTGQYSNNGHGAKGNTTGFEAPGSWIATVTPGKR